LKQENKRLTHECEGLSFKLRELKLIYKENPHLKTPLNDFVKTAQ